MDSAVSFFISLVLMMIAIAMTVFLGVHSASSNLKDQSIRLNEATEGLSNKESWQGPTTNSTQPSSDNIVNNTYNITINGDNNSVTIDNNVSIDDTSNKVETTPTEE